MVHRLPRATVPIDVFVERYHNLGVKYNPKVFLNREISRPTLEATQGAITIIQSLVLELETKDKYEVLDLMTKILVNLNERVTKQRSSDRFLTMESASDN